jgi:hypothetical protein
MKVELTGKEKNRYLNYAYNKIDSIEADMDSLDITLEDINSKSKFKKNPEVNDSVNSRTRNNGLGSNRNNSRFSYNYS